MTILHCGCIPHPDVYFEDIDGCPIHLVHALQGKNAQLKKELEIMRLAAYEGGVMLLDLLPKGYLDDEEEDNEENST